MDAKLYKKAIRELSENPFEPLVLMDEPKPGLYTRYERIRKADEPLGDRTGTALI